MSHLFKKTTIAGMPARRFVLHVRNRNGDAALALFRSVINRIKRPESDLGVVLAQHLGNRRRQRRLAMVNVPNGSDVYMRLVALEFLLRHSLCSSNQNSLKPEQSSPTTFRPGAS